MFHLMCENTENALLSVCRQQPGMQVHTPPPQHRGGRGGSGRGSSSGGGRYNNGGGRWRSRYNPY